MTAKPKLIVRETPSYRSEKIPVLDHGYVELIETWGSDDRIIEAARMSVDRGFEGWGPLCIATGCTESRLDSDKCPVHGDVGTKLGDEKLLRYLYENKHSTPFEMAGKVIEVKAPISVFRQWHRHRSQSYNEMSARYTPLPDENYIPTVERLMMGAGDGKNKQAGTIKGAEILTVTQAELYRTRLTTAYEDDEDLYQWALASGVPKELAREHLPVGRYSKMRAGAVLRNWLAFLTLRADSHAQWEIRQYALAVASLIEQVWPRTYALFAGTMVSS